MSTSIKRILATVLSIAAVAALSIGAFAADTTDTGTGSVTGTVTLNGTITPLTISVTHPLTASYAIDPNQDSAEAFMSPEITVTNNTKVAVNVSVNSLSAIEGGQLTFTDVLPDAKTWSALNLAESKQYIALGIFIKEATGWEPGYNASTMYAADQGAAMFGTLLPATTGSLTLKANFGLAFDAGYTASHSLVFMFELN